MSAGITNTFLDKSSFTTRVEIVLGFLFGFHLLVPSLTLDDTVRGSSTEGYKARKLSCEGCLDLAQVMYPREPAR